MEPSALPYATIVQALKPRFAFERWSGRNTIGENLYVWRFSLGGNELPGWQPHRIQQVNVPALPSAIQSI